jgi:hypothetical protein
MTEAVPGEVERGEPEQKQDDTDPEHPHPSRGAGLLGRARHIRHAGIK